MSDFKDNHFFLDIPLSEDDKNNIIGYLLPNNSSSGQSREEFIKDLNESSPELVDYLMGPRGFCDIECIYLALNSDGDKAEYFEMRDKWLETISFQNRIRETKSDKDIYDYSKIHGVFINVGLDRMNWFEKLFTMIFRHKLYSILKNIDKLKKIQFSSNEVAQPSPDEAAQSSPDGMAQASPEGTAQPSSSMMTQPSPDEIDQLSSNGTDQSLPDRIDIGKLTNLKRLQDRRNIQSAVQKRRMAKRIAARPIAKNANANAEATIAEAA